jgi:hypothetical protein
MINSIELLDKNTDKLYIFMIGEEISFIGDLLKKVNSVAFNFIEILHFFAHYL